MSQDGHATVVRAFSASEGPLALLAKATDGSLYGVIRSTTSSIRSDTTEVVARISTTGTVTPLSYQVRSGLLLGDGRKCSKRRDGEPVRRPLRRRDDPER